MTQTLPRPQRRKGPGCADVCRGARSANLAYLHGAKAESIARARNPDRFSARRTSTQAEAAWGRASSRGAAGSKRAGGAGLRRVAAPVWAALLSDPKVVIGMLPALAQVD